MYRRNNPSMPAQASPRTQAAFQRSPRANQQGRNEMAQYSGPDARPAGDPGQAPGGGAENLRSMLTQQPQPVQPPPSTQPPPPVPQAPLPVAQPGPIQPAPYQPKPPGTEPPPPHPQAPLPGQPQPVPTSGIEALRSGVAARLSKDPYTQPIMPPPPRY